MPPNTESKTESLIDPDTEQKSAVKKTPGEDEPILTFSFTQMYKDTLQMDWSKVLWDMVFLVVICHILALYGGYLLLAGYTKWQSLLFIVVTGYAAGLGITMGAHRLWTHKTFTARWPVRLMLMLMHSTGFQESIYTWCHNHRTHHKWSDTDRDHTNSKRGFFFAHIGWNMYETHPEVIKARKMIDMSDLLEDPITKFQHDYYYWISVPLSFVMPAVVPWYFWNEDPVTAIMFCVFFRLSLIFHSTWLINSVAHIYGYRPYDKGIQASESSFFAPVMLGEGWHNFHHAFPRDYRSSEINGWGQNVTTKVIESLHKIGLVSDLKTVSDEHIEQRIRRTGDASLRIKND